MSPCRAGEKRPGGCGAAPSPHPPWAVGSATRARSARARAHGYMTLAAGACEKKKNGDVMRAGARARARGRRDLRFKRLAGFESNERMLASVRSARGATGLRFSKVIFSLAWVGWVGRSVGAAFFFFLERAPTKKRSEPLRVANVKTQANLKRGAKKENPRAAEQKNKNKNNINGKSGKNPRARRPARARARARPP